MTLEEDFGIINFETDEGRGVDLLPEFLKNSENLKNLDLCVLPEIQEIHDAQSDIYTTINIFDATGDQLDDIYGEILDLEREPGQSDADYRAALLAEASKKIRSGEISVMKGIYRSLTGASQIILTEYQPAQFKMEAIVLSIPSASMQETIRTTLEQAKQGGNGMELSAHIEPFFELTDLPNQLNDPNGLSDSGFDGGILGEGF